MNYSSENNFNIKYIDNSENNYKIMSASFIGKRNFNNDLIKIDNHQGNYIFMIADGHGGNYISKIVLNKLQLYFLKNYKFNKFKNVKKLFKLVDKDIYKQYYLKRYKREGSTLTMIIIYDNSIIGINLGDSSYIIRTSTDIIKANIHRLNNKIEINRVLKNKQKIIKIGNNFRIEGRLELTRSFGDYIYKLKNSKYDGINSTVICVPDHKLLDNNFKYIVLATDGLIDYISNIEIVSIIDKLIEIIPLNNIIEKLIKLAVKRGSNDNISLVIINAVN